MKRDTIVRAAFWPFSDEVINKVLLNTKNAPLDCLTKKQEKGFNAGTPEMKNNNGVKYLPKMLTQMDGKMEYADSAKPSETRTFMITNPKTGGMA